jgi:glutamyl-Q tRNA(Asp) synthetase
MVSVVRKPRARVPGKVWQDAVKFKCMAHLPTPGTDYRGRFAPSPTGDLHLGSLLAALGSWLFARRAGGQWLLRVEDLDPPREVPGATGRQLAALRAFGLEHDGQVLRQSTRGEHYRTALERLLEAGHAFACHCSRSDLAADGGVHRRCVPGASRTDPAIRFRVPQPCAVHFDDALHGRFSQDIAGEVGDFVLRRADGFWAYQLAVVVDDAAQGITQVVRGADLLDSTPRQILLQRALGLPTPAHAHLPLVLDADGRKLSKSLASLPVEADDPLPALRAAWRLLGQDPRLVATARSPAALLREALDGFDPGRIPRTAVVPGHDID